MSTTAPAKTKGAYVYQIVTDRIVAELKNGVIPWEKPWIAGSSAPMNYITREPYKGVNRLLLPLQGEYLTANQVNALKGAIAEGASPHIVTFFTMAEVKKNKKKEDPDEEGTDKVEKRPVFKYYKVFHLTDVRGIESKIEAVSANGDFLRPDLAAEQVVSDYLRRTGVKLERINGDRAAYDAATDTVTIPLLRQFKNSESYYAVLFHELVHSTGSSARLNREVGMAAYDTEDFTKEQLTAEIGANMLLAHCELDTLKVVRNSVSRIAGWIEAFNNDPKLVVNAARAAEKAVNLILGVA